MRKRGIQKILKTKPTIEGAGVHLMRGFSYNEVSDFDPFLLFDDFSGENPSDYRAGFPWHPHRGIETVTYMLKGSAEHKDSIGSSGVIGPGDVQWMTAGSGIIHQEMPIESEEGIQGFQLWVNLPAKNKMMSPRYQDISNKDIQKVEKDGTKVKVIAGVYGDIKGPVSDLMVKPIYFDVSLEKGKTFSCALPKGYTAFLYIISGGVLIGDHDELVESGNIILTTHEDFFECTSTESSAHFLFISGKPLGEKIAWHGPIVMNTEVELQEAFDEYRDGTFVK
ncbi:pirin family protein [Candidatus Kaiserbacteria bacterium]|nr:pirin family protein [Candidatus Kaiserbacteria bacterium]